MQHHHLTFFTNNRPDSIERVLRVVRHRQFQLVQLHLNETNQGYAVTMDVKSDKPIALLAHQLEKLYGLQQLQVKEG